MTIIDQELIKYRPNKLEEERELLNGTPMRVIQNIIAQLCAEGYFDKYQAMLDRAAQEVSLANTIRFIIIESANDDAFKRRTRIPKTRYQRSRPETQGEAEISGYINK